MNRYTILGLAVGLVLGLFIGYEAGSNAGSPSGTAPAGVAAAPPQMPAAAAGDNVQARITSLQAVVARDPKNVEAWIALGNDYFDTRQPQKAIEAYARALELQPNNPNVLTDQGVMYKDVGQFDRAIQNFEKANRVDPKHMQSLYNMGVVYANDLKQPKKAIEVWSKIVKTAPDSEQANQARQAMEHLNATATPAAK